MSKEVLQAIRAICEEKHIPVEAVLSTIEQALAAAYRKDFGNKMQNLHVKFNPETMEIRVSDVKTVVEDQELEEEDILDEKGEVVRIAGSEPRDSEATKAAPVENGVLKGSAQDPKEDGAASPEAVEDGEEEKRFNPKTEIMISEAQKTKADARLGDEIVTELTVPGDFGRMAAQTAKQVIIQRLREAERDVIFNEYKDKEGEIVSGTVQRVEGANVLVDIGQATAVMPPSEQVRSERYTSGMQARFYIKSVSSTNRGPEVIVSRAHPELVHRLFEMEVPEIADRVVEIKSIAREAGSRSKIAVHTSEENVDPVGSCVGQRGTRVQFIISELGGEKIDIIEWEENTKSFIKNALSPAKVSDVVLHEETKGAEAFVAEDQLSLAIGKQGQNVRLASNLTGWKIDIKQDKATVVETVDDRPSSTEEGVASEDASVGEAGGEKESAVPASEAVAEKKDDEVAT